ncbi:DUF542 domain-containing protein [Mucilaginibacter ximonensis]|uniref:DUF542 domain-containing protein n=1 Tax=Mucilaginibacter ximonensis TaxID=538021 RepID=A0ABW5YCC1_9SPHI
MLDISAVAPVFKNAALIEKYDALKPGQSFMLANDANLTAYYHLLSNQRGLNFDWEPMEQGPEKWMIKIIKRSPESDTETIGAIVARDYRKSQALIEYDVDFSCGGNRTLSQALGGQEGAIKEILQQWKAVDQLPAEGRLNYQGWNLTLLSKYISQIHHNFVITQTAFITDMAFKVAASNSSRHPEIKNVAEIFSSVGKLFEHHVETQEKAYFPAIQTLAGAKLVGEEKDLNEEARRLNDAILTEGKDIVNKLRQIRLLTNHYTAPVYTSSACKILYKLLADYEKDALLHFHLENNILFPKVLLSGNM